jgi:hypothetical protein
MDKKYLGLKVLVGFIGAYHLFLGLVLNMPVEVISWIATNLLGATHLPDASALFPARMLGSYMLVFGIGMALVVWDPVKNRALLSLGAILIVLRCFQRVFQPEDLKLALGITAQASWGTVVALLVVATLLLVFRFRLYREK